MYSEPIIILKRALTESLGATLLHSVLDSKAEDITVQCYPRNECTYSITEGRIARGNPCVLLSGSSCALCLDIQIRMTDEEF